MIWLARLRLLKNKIVCNVFNQLCQLQTYNHGLDNKRWSCEICNKKIATSERFFFTRSHLLSQNIVLLIYCFSNNFWQKTTKFESDISRPLTLVNRLNLCTDNIGRFLDRNDTDTGNINDQDQAFVLTIDEIKYFYLVFGVVERNSK